MNLNLEDIKLLLPHRIPFLFLDSCEILEVGKKGIGRKKFLKDEFFFEGHFPKNPIVPGVIIVEALAQTAGVVVSKQFESINNIAVLFMSVNKAKFRKPVYPEDELTLHVNYITNVKSVFKFSGIAYKSEIKVCESEFSAMITHK